MIKILDESIKPEDYNSFVIHPLQSWEWGESRKKAGIEVVRFSEYDKDQIKDVYQMTLHPIPHTPFKLGYIPRSILPSDDLIKFLFKWARTNRVIFIKMEPYVEKSSKINRFSNKSDIVKSQHPLFTPWTQVLDITQPEDKLLERMHHKTRYNIRLAVKKGVIVREENDDKGLKTFLKLYFDTTRRQRYYGHNHFYHKTVWETLKKNIAHIIIAYYNDIPLAAYELFYFKKRLYYVYGGTSELYRNLMASNLLMWEAIKLGKKLGAEEFDMWGSLPPGYDSSNVWSGFTRFKEGYGTKFLEMVGSYDLVVYPAYYKVYSYLYRIREFLLNLRQKFS